MEIVDVEAIPFWYRSRIVRDEEGHIHPGPEHDEFQTLVRIVSDEGVEGYCFGGDGEAIERIVGPSILGENPLYREWIWLRLRRMQRLYDRVTDGVLAAVDMVLWDLAGRYFDKPIYQLLGGYRDQVPAYASTMCEDEIEGGLDTPEAYADFAEACLKRGYRGFKLHTWMPPVRGGSRP